MKNVFEVHLCSLWSNLRQKVILKNNNLVIAIYDHQFKIYKEVIKEHDFQIIYGILSNTSQPINK